MRILIISLFLFAGCAAKISQPVKTEQEKFESDLQIGIWPDRPLNGKDDVIAEKTRRIIKITRVNRPSIELYKAESAAENAPCVIVFPGGGYHILAYDLEGTEIAQWLNSLGFHAVVLKYTVPGNKRQEALQDAQRAVGLVRRNATKWGIDPAKIGVLGFSAGGHLAAHVSTNYQKRAYKAVDKADKVSCRPDFSVLVYPAYIYEAKDKTKIAPEIKVDENTPPAFIVQTLNDRNYIDSAFNYCRALKDANVDAELHLYSKGGHGYGARKSKFRVSEWPQVCGKWLKKITE